VKLFPQGSWPNLLIELTGRSCSICQTETSARYLRDGFLRAVSFANYKCNLQRPQYSFFGCEGVSLGISILSGVFAGEQSPSLA
jgi:hypothetical protein